MGQSHLFVLPTDNEQAVPFLLGWRDADIMVRVGGIPPKGILIFGCIRGGDGGRRDGERHRIGAVRLEAVNHH